MVWIVEIETPIVLYALVAGSKSGDGTAVTLRPGEEYVATRFTDFHALVQIPDGRSFLLAEVPRACVRVVSEGPFLPEFEAAAD